MSPFLEPDDEFLSLPRVARMLGVVRRTVEREMARGMLPPPVKVGGRSLLPRSEVQAYMAEAKKRRKTK